MGWCRDISKLRNFDYKNFFFFTKVQFRSWWHLCYANAKYDIYIHGLLSIQMNFLQGIHYKRLGKTGGCEKKWQRLIKQTIKTVISWVGWKFETSRSGLRKRAYQYLVIEKKKKIFKSRRNSNPLIKKKFPVFSSLYPLALKAFRRLTNLFPKHHCQRCQLKSLQPVHTITIYIYLFNNTPPSPPLPSGKPFHCS